MDETRFGTNHQLCTLDLDNMTDLEKESEYLDPCSQPFEQERYAQQEEQPWREDLWISWIEDPINPTPWTSSFPS
jgi:hypothetical protein